MEKEKYAGYRMRRVSRLLGRCMEHLQISHGVDNVVASYGWILNFLRCHQERDIYQRDIETEFRMPRSTVTCIVKSLEKSGYIKRSQVENDARLKKLELTEEGIKLDDFAHRNIEFIEKTACEGISESDMKTFFEIIDKMENNISRILEDKKEGENTTC